MSGSELVKGPSEKTASFFGHGGALFHLTGLKHDRETPWTQMAGTQNETETHSNPHCSFFLGILKKLL
jgi:hypothetical protein